MSESEERQNKLLPVKFITEKDPSFRTYHADGAWGMANAVGNIQLSFFVEHNPLPISVLHPINKDGNISNEGEITSLNEQDENNFIVIRDFQMAVVLQLEAAKNIHRILENFIKLSEDSTETENENKE
jgi:hypothetical protein